MGPTRGDDDAWSADVANAYFELRALDLQLDIAQRTLASRKESLQLTQVRESGGVTSLLDVREAEQLVFGAGAAIVDLERRIAQQENLISMLLGNFPAPITRGRALEDQPQRRTCRPGCPRRCSSGGPTSRRRSSRSSPRTRRSASRASAYFPSISLTGNGGCRARALGALFAAGAGYLDRDRRRRAAGLHGGPHAIAGRARGGAHARGDGPVRSRP